MTSAKRKPVPTPSAKMIADHWSQALRSPWVRSWIAGGGRGRQLDLEAEALLRAAVGLAFGGKPDPAKLGLAIDALPKSARGRRAGELLAAKGVELWGALAWVPQVDPREPIEGCAGYLVAGGSDGGIVLLRTLGPANNDPYRKAGARWALVLGHYAPGEVGREGARAAARRLRASATAPA